MNKGGTALIIVLVMMSLLSVLMLHAWFISGFQFDIATQQIVWYKHFYATEAGLNIGVTTVRAHFDDFYKRAQNAPVAIDVSLNGVLGNQRVMLFVQKVERMDNRVLLLSARCLQQSHCVCCIRCLLNKIDVMVDNKREQYFVVSGFSFGTDI
jgi:hypothetical protein